MGTCSSHPLTFYQIKEAVLLERDLAKNALNNGEYELAWIHLEQALNRLTSSELNEACNALLISTTIEFQNICISLGKGLSGFEPILKRAKAAAEQIGDRRSLALLLLHLGRFYNYHGSKDDALALFEEGKSEVEKLGDEDLIAAIRALFLLQVVFRRKISMFQNKNIGFRFAGTTE